MLVKIEYKVRFAHVRFYTTNTPFYPESWEHGWKFEVDIVDKVEGFMWSLRFWDPDLNCGLDRLLDTDKWQINRKKILEARARGEEFTYT